MSLTVATYNLYLGASLIPAYGAPTVPAMAEALRAAHAGMVRTDFPERAEAIAGLLAAARPDVVGLQEVASWDDAGDRCDFLRLLCTHLPGYRVASVVVTSSLGFHTGGREISVIDRGAVLVRADREHRAAGHQVFGRRFRFPTAPGVVVTKLRGWCWADVVADGLPVRVASTHLEAYDAAVAAAQAAELRDALGGHDGPVVLVGDLNSTPDQQAGAHDVLVSSGFRDTWPELHGQAPGYTGEQPSSLDNEESLLHRRVDHVLWRDDVLRPHRMELVGTERLPSGLWPSDHAGLVAEFRR